jgi:hypothetical protein
VADESITKDQPSNDDAADSEDLRALRMIVTGVPWAVGRTIEKNGGRWEPASDSQYTREVSEQGPFVGRSQTPVADAYSVAVMRHAAAIQHFADLARLLVPPRSSHGPATILRSAIENCAWAWWALDPAIDVKQRIARGLSAVIENLNEAIRFPSAELQSESLISRDGIASDAEAHGMHVQRKEGDGSPLWVEEKPPSITKLIEMQLGENGTIAYRELSAVAHGTLFGLTTRLKKARIELKQPGITLMEPAAPFGVLLYSTAISLDSFFDATDRRFSLYGWDVTHWNGWKREAKLALLPVLQRNAG